MVVVAGLEILSIGLTIPFLSAMSNPNVVYGIPLLGNFFHLMGFSTDQRSLQFAITIIFGSAIALSAIFRILLLWAQTKLSYAAGAQFSQNIYKSVLLQPYAVHINRNSSEVIVGVTVKSAEIINAGIAPALTLLSSAIIIAIILVGLILINLKIAIFIAFFFGLFYLVITIKTKKKLSKLSMTISNETGKVVKAIQEGLGGIREIILDGNQGIYLDIFKKSEDRLRNSIANVKIISGTPRYLIESFGMILIVVIAYVNAGKQDDSFSSSIPILGAIALGAQRLLPVLQQSFSSWVLIKGGMSSISDALNLIDEKLIAFSDESAKESHAIKNGIKIDRLWFRYTPDTNWVLKDLNLYIKKGERVGIIGRTGSGKSTLVDLVMGLLTPVKGGVYYDENLLTPTTLPNYKSCIAHVPQTIFLLDATIGENIAFNLRQDEIDIERLKKACKMAALDGVVNKMPNGFKTMVGERGISLSGGQKQRIGIARALYKGAHILIFDEATSALDAETEGEVMEALSGLSAEITILIIAHRVTTLRNCTRVLDLVDGVIKRDGTFDEIISMS
jgi:ABC-type multidrug transport system fused ATPase/permease subunit